MRSGWRRSRPVSAQHDEASTSPRAAADLDSGRDDGGPAASPAQPDTTQPGNTQPGNTQPGSTEPDTTEPAPSAPTPESAELQALRQELLVLTGEVSRNHGLLMEVQGMARRLLESRLSFADRDAAAALAALVAPRVVRGPGKIRVGSAHDGGYVLLDDLAATPAVLCGGVGDNIDFERAMASAGHRVHVYDHTVAGLPGEGDEVTFFREPLGPEGTGLAAALARLDSEPVAAEPVAAEPVPGDDTAPADDATPADDSPVDVLLKVDIDGGEWVLLAEAGPQLPRFRQIALELHGLHQVSDPLWRERALTALAVVARTHTPVHVHANNHGAYAIVGGIPLPDILEVTYARTDSYSLHADDDDADASFVDAPNDASRPEFTLAFPR